MSFPKKTVTIIGSGWLGLPLALHLQILGFDVCITTTTLEKQARLIKQGINTLLFPSTSNADLQKRLNCSTEVIITIPPGVDQEKTANVLHQLVGMISSESRILYTSSTGVYRHLSKSDQLIEVDENAEAKGPLASLESILMNAGNPFLLFRLGGLCGAGRHPGRFLAGKKNIADGNSVVNLVHLKDVIQWMTYLLNTDIVNEIYQITADYHPQRQEFYPKAALQIGREAPEFNPCDLFPAGIFVSNAKIKAMTGLPAIFPDPFGFEYE